MSSKDMTQAEAWIAVHEKAHSLGWMDDWEDGTAWIEHILKKMEHGHVQAILRESEQAAKKNPDQSN